MADTTEDSCSDYVTSDDEGAEVVVAVEDVEAAAALNIYFGGGGATTLVVSRFRVASDPREGDLLTFFPAATSSASSSSLASVATVRLDDSDAAQMYPEGLAEMACALEAGRARAVLGGRNKGRGYEARDDDRVYLCDFAAGREVVLTRTRNGLAALIRCFRTLGDVFPEGCPGITCNLHGALAPDADSPPLEGTYMGVSRTAAADAWGLAGNNAPTPNEPAVVLARREMLAADMADRRLLCAVCNFYRSYDSVGLYSSDWPGGPTVPATLFLAAAEALLAPADAEARAGVYVERDGGRAMVRADYPACFARRGETFGRLGALLGTPAWWDLERLRRRGPRLRAGVEARLWLATDQNDEVVLEHVSRGAPRPSHCDQALCHRGQFALLVAYVCQTLTRSLTSPSLNNYVSQRMLFDRRGPPPPV